MSDHAWGDNRILTFLPEGRNLYRAFMKNDPDAPIAAPRFISCWVSEVCNLDCTYCFFSETNHDKSHLYIDTKAFVRWLDEARAAGSESLEFSGGGEPTLHPDFLQILLAARAMGYETGMITHACNDMPLPVLVKEMKYVRCGLDAATAATHDAIKRNKRKDYWFHKAIENIKELVRLRGLRGKQDFTVGIKVVLNSINFHETEEMIVLAKQLGVNYIQIKREHSSGNDLTEQQQIEAQAIIDKHAGMNEFSLVKVLGTMQHARATAKCFMSPIHTVVTATGKVLQCCFFESRPIGTIFKPFSETWGSDEHRRVVRETTVAECDKVDCRWNFYNRRIKDVIEDPLAQASFI